MRKMWHVLAVLVSLEVAASASPVDVSIVPADAGAVIHVDLGAVKRSRVWAHVSKQAGGDPMKMFMDGKGPDDPKAALLVEALTGADGVTVWLDDKGEEGLGAFYGVDTARLTRGLSSLPGHSTEKLGRRTLHRLGSGDDDDCLVVEGRWVLVSEKPGPIAKSLAALDGTGKRL